MKSQPVPFLSLDAACAPPPLSMHPVLRVSRPLICAALQVIAGAALLLPSILNAAPQPVAAQSPPPKSSSQPLPVQPLKIHASQRYPYLKNQPVTFEISVSSTTGPDSEKEAEWNLAMVGQRPFKTGHLKLRDGRGIISEDVKQPGFVQCTVSFPGTPRSEALAVAAHDWESVRPSTQPPSDFDTFWAEQKRRLSAVLPGPLVNEITSPSSGVTCFDVQVGSIEAPVSAYLARPSAAAPKSLPAILLLHEAGVQSSQLGSAAEWAATGALAMDMNAHGVANGQPPDFYQALQKGPLHDWPLKGQESRETNGLLALYLRVLRAIDFLASQPEWDGKKLALYGSHQGGTQALAGAALEERVSFFAINAPCLCDLGTALVSTSKGWPGFSSMLPPGLPADLLGSCLLYFDAAHLASRIHVPGMIILGLTDPISPPMGVAAACNVLSGQKEVFLDPSGTSSVSPAAQQALYGALRKHLFGHQRKTP